MAIDENGKEVVPAGWVRVESNQDGLILDPRKDRVKKGDQAILPRDVALHLGDRVKIIEENHGPAKR